MIVDADWSAIAPHASTLIKVGYGYSCVGAGNPADINSVIEMLADWGWASDEPPPSWLLSSRPQ